MSVIINTETRNTTPSITSEKLAEFEKLLRASIQVTGDFGAVLEVPHPDDGLGPLRSETRLPHARDTISFAIEFLQAAITEALNRQIAESVLTSEEMGFILSNAYVKSLASCRVLLDTFVPDIELSKQRKLAADTASLVSHLGPEERKKFMDKLPPYAADILAAASRQQD